MLGSATPTSLPRRRHRTTGLHFSNAFRAAVQQQEPIVTCENEALAKNCKEMVEYVTASILLGEEISCLALCHLAGVTEKRRSDGKTATHRNVSIRVQDNRTTARPQLWRHREDGSGDTVSLSPPSGPISTVAVPMFSFSDTPPSNISPPGRKGLPGKLLALSSTDSTES